jgi:GNAT superfamily N-acetyltransferase
VAVSDRFGRLLCEMWRSRAEALGGTSHDEQGLLVCLTGVAHPPFNPTLVATAPGDPVAALTAAEAHAQHAGLPFGIDMDVDRHPELRTAAIGRGLHLTYARPAMWARVDQGAVPFPPGVRVEPAETRLDELAAIDAAAFGAPATASRALLTPDVFADPRARAYVAVEADRAIAAAQTFLFGGVLGVFGVGTLPPARGRGIASALTAHVVEDHIGQADVAVLQPSEAGRSLYERLGFVAEDAWEVWVRT